MKAVAVWWANDPLVTRCTVPGCGCPIQRRPSGTVEEGMDLHLKTVHGERWLR